MGGAYNVANFAQRIRRKASAHELLGRWRGLSFKPRLAAGVKRPFAITRARIMWLHFHLFAQIDPILKQK
jgi:hypothetical protein